MIRPLMLALAVVFACTNQSPAAVIADLVADYLPGVNAGDVVMPPATGTGVWRYLKSDSHDTGAPGANLADLQWDAPSTRFEHPNFPHNNGYDGDTIGVPTPSNELVMHPTDTSTFGIESSVVARWTAGPGEAGLIDITGNVRKGSSGGGDGIRMLIYVGGVSLFDQVIAFNDNVGLPIALINVPINEGSAVDFVVDSNNNNAFYDSTLLKAAISLVLPGDLDRDGFVGITDLNIVLGAWNQSVPPADPAADPSGDNFVGIEDLNAVLGNWNAGTPPADLPAPEPTSLALLLIGCGAATGRRK